MRMRWIALLVLAAQALPAAAAKRAPDFTLEEPREGKKVALADFKDRKAVVVVFVGTECPVNNQYMPRLVELAREYGPRGVAFLAINSNVQDNPARVAEHARRYELPFPVLKDPASAVADGFGARRTPEAFLLDGARNIVYRGRIDDQYGILSSRAKPTSRDLAEAIDAVLAGKAVARSETEVAGCLVARPIKPKGTATVTYARDVSRIIQNHCQECHRPGQIGPMALMNYEDATAWAETIKEVVEEGRMPPWFADPKHGAFLNDRRLPDEEKRQLLKWIDEGCPKGDEKDLPPPKTWVAGWTIGKPDAVFTMQEEFTVPAQTPRNGVPYKYFWVDTNFAEDRWITHAEAKAGANAVVHHIIVFIEYPGEKYIPGGPGRVLCGTAPGDMPLILPKGLAKKLPKGSRLVFQMHYTPNGKEQKDRSSVGLIFSKEPPEREALTLGLSNPRFAIPPGHDNYKVERTFTFREDGHIYGFMPHMHLRGKSFLYEAIHPDGKKETLLWVPRYNFNWQSSYRLLKPYPMPKGSTLRCVAHYDNSAKNPNNPDPTKEVRWGDQTWEEMMIGWTELVFDRKPQ